MDDALGVGIRAEAMPARFEIGSQLTVVVDFAVEDDPHRFVFVGERLMAGAQVDDRETAKAECGREAGVNEG